MTRTLADPVAVSAWIAVTLTGVVVALVAGQAVWAVVAWAAGGAAVTAVATVETRRGK